MKRKIDMKRYDRSGRVDIESNVMYSIEKKKAQGSETRIKASAMLVKLALYRLQLPLSPR